MKTEYLILLVYFSGVIAAAFAIKVYNKHKTLFYDKAPPFGMLLSWVGMVVILVSIAADFWQDNFKKRFNKFFNY